MSLESFRYYLILARFRALEVFSDLKASGFTYLLYGFFIWVLAQVWKRHSQTTSIFTYESVVVYIGITEMLFMSFLSTRYISASTEDFSLFLVRPRSWIVRETVNNIGGSTAKRLLFFFCLILLTGVMGIKIESPLSFALRICFLLIVLAVPQALVSSLFSACRLSYPQTDYFILPFSKLFLSLGGVFGPLSDYGEPWRSGLLLLPGSDLFFQPAYFAIFGEFYQQTLSEWLWRFALINLILLITLVYFYRRGRKVYQAWGG